MFIPFISWVEANGFRGNELRQTVREKEIGETNNRLQDHQTQLDATHARGSLAEPSGLHIDNDSETGISI